MFSCPQLLYYWYFTPEGGDPEREIALNVSDEVLVKENVSRSNSGQYYCRASNIHGQVESRKARLYVLDYSPATPTVSVKFNLTSESPANSSGATQEGSTQDEDNVVVFDSHLIKKTTELIAQHMLLSDRDYVKNIQVTSGLPRQLSFILERQSIPSTNEDEIFDDFATSSLKLEESVKSLRESLEGGEFSIPWRSGLKVTGEANTLKVGFARPKCPEGQEVHTNGFLCGE